MADDGMLLNFSVTENVTPAATSTQKFKGGSWRDRLRAKRSAQRAGRGGEGQKKTNDPNSTPISQRRSGGQGQRSAHSSSKDLAGEFPDSQPAKRRRENGYVPALSTGPASNQRRNEQRHAPSGPREVISSLFTYNPKPSTATEESQANGDDKPAVPSNAPLVDGIDTFTSLGLSSTVAAHLLTKMKLKTPTAIQKAAISQMLNDTSDAFIQSETGSGKTLAYLLPVVQRIMTLSEQIQTELSPAGAGNAEQAGEINNEIFRKRSRLRRRRDFFIPVCPR